MLKALGVGVFIVATAVSAGAETIGTITASIDGGENRTWFVTAQEGESQSGWTQIMPGSLNGASFQLWGNPTADALASMEDALLIGAVMMRGPGGVMPIGDAGLLENGFTRHWISLEDDPVDMTLDKAEATDAVLEVSGSFTARVYYTEDPVAQDVDKSRSKTITGQFEAALPMN